MKDEKLLLLGLGLYAFKRRNDARKAREAKARETAKVGPAPRPAALTPPPATPVTYAWLFRRPADTFITMTVGPDPEHAAVRGTFDDEEVARRVVKESGFTLAWPDVRDLD